MPLRNGFTPNVFTSGGPQPSIDLYVVIAGSNNTLHVELLDANGQMIFQGSVTVTSSASLLKTLVSALTGGADAWALADGAVVKNTGGGTIYLNTSGATTVGLAPTTSSALSWLAGEVNTIGFISG